MPVLAVCCLHLTSDVIGAPPDIFTSGYWLQVFWPYAIADTAEMVNVVPNWNRPDKDLVKEPMKAVELMEARVSTTVNSSTPEPTCFCYFNESRQRCRL